MALSRHPFMDVEDYLVLDRNSKETRYEYLDGELIMLAGGSTYHSIIIANLTAEIVGPLKNSPCLVYNSDIRLQLSESRYVHPDIAVSCNESDHELDEMINHPRLVVEVLSPSTENIDRGKKLIYYRECPSIQEYVMVDSLSIRVEVYHRDGDIWKIYTYDPESTVRFNSLDIQIPINDIYRGLKLTEKRTNNKNKKN